MSKTEKNKLQEEITKIYHSKINHISNTENIVSSNLEVIAGIDDRKDYYQLPSTATLQKQLVDSTVILTDKSNLTQQADGSYKLKTKPFRRNGFKACARERFGNQETGGWCSGFMVGSDVIVTAGHCGKTEADIQNTAYVFGFRVDNKGDTGTTEFHADQVYFGKELIAHDLSDNGDFGIVRVDRQITATGAQALKVRESGSIGPKQNIGVIGYPSGLPVKIAFGSSTVVMRNEDPWLFANLDTYGGNSGSPVFNTEGLVEGILVRGAKDYNIDLINSCFLSNRIIDANGSETVTKSNVFVNHIPEL